MSDDETVADGPRRVGAPAKSRPPAARATSAHVELDARYRGATEIARGGMGRVLVATDSVLGRTVAVKEALATDDETLRRFARETRITARLEHPSIVPVYDAGVTKEGSPFYVMRKVSGRPLDQLVMAATTLDRRLALVPNVLAAAQAVAHAHERGVLHRDLKPTNILVGVLGETVVIDWGLAKVVDEPDDPDDDAAAAASMSMGRAPLAAPAPGDSLHTRIGTVFGTPGFMAPEQVRGETVDARSDVYALGATLYYVLAQGPPHAGRTGEDMMDAAMGGPPTPIATLAPGTPRELAAIVDKALAYTDHARYAHAGELAADLMRYLTGQLVASHAYSSLERVTRFVRRNRVAVAVAALALVALAAMGAVSLRSVLAARDRADIQARLASTRQHEAEVAEATALERADQLLLTQARTLVATDPTAAVGLLKQLRASPASWATNWRAARGIAAGARAAGIAYEIPGVDDPTVLELSPDGTHALVSGRDGSILVADLVTRTASFRKAARARVVAHFAGDGRLLLDDSGALTLVDLASGAQQPLVLPGYTSAPQPTSTAVFWTDAGHRLWRTDFAGRGANVLPVTDVERFEVAEDGRVVLVATRHELVRLDLPIGGSGSRTVLAAGAPSAMDWDPVAHTAWAQLGARLGKFAAGGAAEWTPLPQRIASMTAIGERLFVVGEYGFQELVRGRWFDVGGRRIDLSSPLQRTRDDYLVAMIDGSLELLRWGTRGEIHMPTLALTRVASSPTSRFIVGSTPGHLLVWDVGALIPPRFSVPAVNAATMLPDDRVAFLRSGRWFALDLASHVETLLPFDMPPMAIRVEARGDRYLVYSVLDPSLAFVARGGVVSPLNEEATFATLLDTGEVLAATVRGAVVRVAADGHHRETVVARASTLQSLAWVGTHIAALWSDGTLWRTDTATGREETTQVAASTLDRSLTLISDADGAVTVPSGARVVQWQADGTQVELAVLPGPIMKQDVSRSQLIVTTADGTTYLVDRGGRHQVRTWLASANNVAFSVAYQSELAVFQASGSSPEVQDLVTGVHWPLGHRDLQPQSTQSMISDTGRFVVSLENEGASALSVYSAVLPPSADATGAWLDQLTNALVDDPSAATVTWPQPTGQVLQPLPQ